jgi:hypothetical protein
VPREGKLVKPQTTRGVEEIRGVLRKLEEAPEGQRRVAAAVLQQALKGWIQVKEKTRGVGDAKRKGERVVESDPFNEIGVGQSRNGM